MTFISGCRIIALCLAASLTAACQMDTSIARDAGVVAAATYLGTSKSTEAQTQVGNSARADVLRGKRQSKDGAMSGYLQQMVEKIAFANNLDDFNWQVYLLADKSPNAFTPGGGVLFVNEGFLRLTPNEADMAIILAHEMAHVTRGHSVEKQRAAAVVNVGAVLLDGYIRSQGKSSDSLTRLGRDIAIGGAVSQFSQAKEREADTLGFRYYTKAGYQPVAARRVFARISRLQGGNGGLNAILGSHPTPKAREEALIRLSRGASAPTRGIETTKKWSRLVAGYRRPKK